MWNYSENVLLVLSVVVQVMGIGGVLAARLNSNEDHRGAYNFVTVLCFAVVGVLSLLLMRSLSMSWLAFATTMPLMAVFATMDLRKTSESSF